MKIIKRILKSILLLIFLLLILVIGVGTYAFRHPKETWAVVENHFLPKDLKISWSDLHVHVPHSGLRQWEPNFDAHNLCMKKNDPALDICLDELQFRGNISFEEWLRPQLKIVNLVALSEHLNYFRPNSKKEETKSPEQNIYDSIQAWRKRLQGYTTHAEVGSLDIRVQHFELRSKENPPLIFAVKLQSEKAYDQAKFAFALERSPGLEIKANGSLQLQNFFRAQGKFFQAESRIATSKIAGKVEDLEMTWISEKEIGLKGQIDLKIKKINIQNTLAAELSGQDFKGQVRTNVLGLQKPLDHLKPISTRFNIPQETGFLWSKKKSSVEVSAYVPLFFVDAKIRPRLEKACKCQIPEELAANVEGDGYASRFFDTSDGHLADVKAKLQNLNNSLFNTRIEAALSIARKDKEYELKPAIDSEIVLTSFQGLAIFLQEQKAGVPAPLSQLDGKIIAKAKGPIRKAEDDWQLPFNIDVNLASEKQRLETVANGSVSIDQALSYLALDINILLKNIVLELPPLDPVYGMPKVTPDKRIVRTPPQEKKKNRKMRVEIAVHVRSEKENSIQLLYPLAHPSIPLSLSLDYTSGSPITGEIKLSSFGIEYLRRRSQVERFKFSINQPVGIFPVDARMRVDQFPYKIYIDILGNLKSPQVVLSSDPYLDRSDIISVLIYGRPSNQLVSGDAKTVGSFDAAMADRAIGLVGLWALSSTPIQSFSYNQLSQQYSAQVKLSDDTSLSVGTNWEQAASLEVQKRLSDHWMIDASLEPTEEEQQTRKLRLQWEDRF